MAPFSELRIPFVYAGEVMAAGIVIPMVAISMVASRFWLRSFKHIGVGADDWFILASLVFNMGMGICLIYGVAKHSLGYPTPIMPGATPMTQLTTLGSKQRLVELLDWITWLLMVPANGCIKISCIFLYRRLFVVNKKSTFDIVTKVSLVVCGLWTIAFFFATVFGCGKHFTYPWGPLGEIMKCDTNTRLDALMISDLLTDIWVWLLPIPMVWTLNMKRSKKLSVTGILLLAAMSLAAAVVRLLVQEQISTGGYAAHTDVNLTLTVLLYWSMIETGVALIAACLPTLQTLISRPSASVKSLLSTVRSWRTSSSRSHTSTASSRTLRGGVGDSYSEIKGGAYSAEYPRSLTEYNMQIPPSMPMEVPETPGQIHVQSGFAIDRDRRRNPAHT